MKRVEKARVVVMAAKHKRGMEMRSRAGARTMWMVLDI